MGAFDNLMSGVAGVPASDDGRAGQVEKSAHGSRSHPDLDDELPLWARKALSRGIQQLEDSPGYVQKQNARRRAQLPQALQDTVEEEEQVAKKPYDPILLRDLASSTIPQTYTDTLAQDLASANWRLRALDDDATVPDDVIAQAERKLRNLVPDNTFSEFLEVVARNLLRLGDATIVKHYPGGDPTNPVAEIVQVDSATMFKRLDEDGFPAGYVQFTGNQTSSGTDYVGTDLVLDEVVWISWALRDNHVYGEGPVEKGQDTIEVLEEIAEKELLDLIQGMPPGVISRPNDAEVPIDSADWENFKADMRLSEGERHRLGYANFPVDYTPLTPNYQELQLLDRYTTKVTELGGVFKVNPSYAGFDFENVNRATDQSQQAAYKQRGFQVLLNRIEEALSLGVVPDLLPTLDLDGDTTLVFEFERETTVEEKQERANAIADAVDAGKQAADAGLDVSWRDGQPVIENGPMEAGNVGSDGGGGGLFGSENPPDSPGDAGETAVEGDRTTLSKEEVEKLDDILYQAHVEQIHPESVEDITEKRVFSSDDVPDYVLEKIEEALDDGAVFDAIESAGDRVQEVKEAVTEILEDNLLDESGWSLRGIRDDIQAEFPNLSKGEAEQIARTETTSTLNTAREKGYEERDDSATLHFKWTGPQDSRTTDACEFLKHGSGAVEDAPFDFPGTHDRPLDMEDLKRVERQASEFYFDLSRFRDHVIHPDERHTFRRVLPAEMD